MCFICEPNSEDLRPAELPWALYMTQRKHDLYTRWERVVGTKPDRTVDDIVNVLMRDDMRPVVKELMKDYEEERVDRE